MKTKIEKIIENGEVIGYKLGNHYLVKIWGWRNRYDWAINDEPQNTYFSVDEERRLAEGKMYFVDSCKQGKEELLRLAKGVQ